jgi:5-methylcytosine-specific restriction enzyme MrcB-like protein
LGSSDAGSGHQGTSNGQGEPCGRRSASGRVAASYRGRTLRRQMMKGRRMQLRELIERIGRQYDRKLPMDSGAQQLLRRAGDELRQWVPEGYLPVGSGGKGNGAICPWVAVFDPDETRTAQRGMYVVYLFAADMSTVTLSLNQGVTEIGQKLGRPAGRRALKGEAAAIRERFAAETIADLDQVIDLRSRADLPVDYEYGNIFARTYTIRALPDEVTMVADLRRFVQLYALALEAREDGHHDGDTAIVTPPRQHNPRKTSPEFKPKNDADYRQVMEGRELVKTRKHETLIKAYGTFLQGRGFDVATNVHPRDLIATADGCHWLIEAKIVRAGDGVGAAREALAQLLFYARFLYQSSEQVNKLALFNDSVGDACVDFLEELGIATVWRADGRWVGSSIACTVGLTE